MTSTEIFFFLGEEVTDLNFEEALNGLKNSSMLESKIENLDVPTSIYALTS